MTRYSVIAATSLTAALSLLPSSANAATITLDATIRGWYEPAGSANGASATNNYIAGDCRGNVCGGALEPGDFRNWFKFDVSSISGTVSSAVLLLDVDACFPGTNNQHGCGYFSTSDASETYMVFDVAPGNVGSLGANSLAIFTDLGGGTSYGFHIATAADNGTTVSISLNAAGLSALQAALGSNFAVGGAITTLNGVPDDEYLFGSFSDFNQSQAHTRLQITTVDAVPEPATLLLLATALSGLAARRRMRKP